MILLLFIIISILITWIIIITIEGGDTDSFTWLGPAA